jgi:peptide/nickel transport system substrate-binding protein
VDIAMRGIEPEQMVELWRRWAPCANKYECAGGSVLNLPNDIRVLSLTFLIEGQPWEASRAGWQTDVRFRQAILHSINRDELADTSYHGYADVVYFPALPEFPTYRRAEERGLPKYPYDPSQAQRLFAEAGWNKGPDGLLRNSAGQTVPFFCCRYSDADSNDIRESLVWGNYLKDAGLEVIHPIPQAPAGLSAAERRRVQVAGWGGRISNLRVAVAQENLASLAASNLPTQDNRWSGTNAGAWVHPQYEDVFARSMRTLDASQRLDLEFQLIQVIMNELPILPAYANPTAVAYRAGVLNVGRGNPFNRGNTADIHLWDIKMR